MSAFDDDDDDDWVTIEDDTAEIDLDAWLEKAKLETPDDTDPSYAIPADDEEPSLTREQIKARQQAIFAKRLEPKPFVLKGTNKRIAVVDTETDPFEFGRIVRPFTVGFYDGERYVDFWGADCVEQFFAYLATLDEQFIIYAHNGGKFDFHFFTKYLDQGQSPLIMGGRLVKISFAGQEFRDSFAIIPQALSAYKKDEVDYSTFEEGKREAHRATILAYQKTDCIYTYELIAGFHAMFGDKLTIASASLPMLNSFTGFERFKSEAEDERFRAYYYGGRNQCFETGDLRPRPGRKWLVVDRNSMYPAVMRDALHPVSARPVLQRTITKDTDFACIMARNDGALPMRAEDGSLDFTVKYGKFYATIHEINAGLETRTLRIDRVLHAWTFARKVTFGEFVERFYGLRLDAKAADDKVRDILYKFCLNSGYGKFALNPRKFREWKMTTGEIPQPQQSAEHPKGWTFHSCAGDIYIWSRPSPRKKGFYNVATAASITGAARANLLRNLSLATRPVYCDTDSIICEAFRGETEEKALGGWKLEATGDRVAIGGKKLYAVWNDGDPIKKACKGVNLSPAEILRVCQGEEILYRNPVPTFALGTDLDSMTEKDFVTRRVNKTGRV